MFTVHIFSHNQNMNLFLCYDWQNICWKEFNRNLNKNFVLFFFFSFGQKRWTECFSENIESIIFLLFNFKQKRQQLLTTLILSTQFQDSYSVGSRWKGRDVCSTNERKYTLWIRIQMIISLPSANVWPIKTCVLCVVSFI